MERSPSSTFQRGKPSSESPMPSHPCTCIALPCCRSACISGGHFQASIKLRRCCDTGSRGFLQRTCSSISRSLQQATWVRAKPPLPLLMSTSRNEGFGPDDQQQRLIRPGAALAIGPPLLCVIEWPLRLLCKGFMVIPCIAGIWTKDLKLRTNLQNVQVRQCRNSLYTQLPQAVGWPDSSVLHL